MEPTHRDGDSDGGIHDRNDGDGKASRTPMVPALLALALLRVFAAVAFPGMVHPDEFFQSQEVMARHVLQNQPLLQQQLWLPWEYELPTPNRSILFPALVAGLPYHALQWLGIEPTGYLLLIVPRLLLCFASFAIDIILYKIAVKRHEQSPLRVVFLFATSWPTLVLLTRPFSNAGETLILALSFAVLVLVDPHRRVVAHLLHLQTLLLGALLAIGVFTRFTFVVFFVPIALELARNQDAQGFVTFAICSFVIVVVDTLYFRADMRSVAAWRDASLREMMARLVVAPLNNAVYNAQAANLALHGTHARITHVVVNLPLLFGPLALQFVYTFVTYLRHARVTNFNWFCITSVVVPLLSLSLAPHQEPRFLLPLLVPLVVFATPTLLFATRKRLTLWLVFNAALTVAFGVLHQGGIVPLLLTFATGPNCNTLATCSKWPLQHPFLLSTCTIEPDALALVGRVPLVFFRTYMPPRFLLAGIETHAGFAVVDLAGGGSNDELASQLQRVFPFAADSATDTNSSNQALLVMPASVSIDRIVATASVEAAKRVGQCAPHVSTEDFALDKPFALALYVLEVTNAAA